MIVRKREANTHDIFCNIIDTAHIIYESNEVPRTHVLRTYVSGRSKDLPNWTYWMNVHIWTCNGHPQNILCYLGLLHYFPFYQYFKLITYIKLSLIFSLILQKVHVIKNNIIVPAFFNLDNLFYFRPLAFLIYRCFFFHLDTFLRRSKSTKVNLVYFQLPSGVSSSKIGALVDVSASLPMTALVFFIAFAYVVFCDAIIGAICWLQRLKC